METVEVMHTDTCEVHENCDVLPAVGKARNVFNNFIDLKCGNQKLEAMIDSGSGCCLISSQTKSKLPESHIRKLPLESKYIVGVGNKIQPILSRSELNMTIGNKNYKYAFNEVENTKHTLIGADFLQKYDATHSHGPATITLEGGNKINMHRPSYLSLIHI